MDGKAGLTRCRLPSWREHLHTGLKTPQLSFQRRRKLQDGKTRRPGLPQQGLQEGKKVQLLLCQVPGQEVPDKMGDAFCLQRMTKDLDPRLLCHLLGDVRRLFLYIRKGQHRKRGQVLGAVRPILEDPKGCQLLDDLLPLLAAPALFYPAETLCLLLSLPLSQLPGGEKHHLGTVWVLQEILPDKLLKISVFYSFPQAQEGVPQAEILGRIPSVEAALQHFHAVEKPLGKASCLLLPIAELHPADDRLQPSVVQPLGGQLLQHCAHGIPDLLLLLFGGMSYHQDGKGLLDAVHLGKFHILSQPSLQQRLLKRRLVRAAEHLA